MHIYERYSDADAAVAHVGRFVENFAGRLLDLCTPTRMSVYGDATEEVRAATAGFNPRFDEADRWPRQELVSRIGWQYQDRGSYREYWVGVGVAV